MVEDPYERLANLLWLLRPVDVVELVVHADRLAEQRIASLYGIAPEA
jgi:hypothetical protein